MCHDVNNVGSGTRVAYGMNPSGSTPTAGQHGDPGWALTDNSSSWDHHHAVNHNTAVAAVHLLQSPVNQAGPRQDWTEWENPMLLAQGHNPTAVAHDVEPDRKPQLMALPTAASVCGRSYALANYSPSAAATVGHSFQQQQQVTTSSLRSYPTGPGLDHHSYHQAGHYSFYSSAGHESELNGELRSYDQRRRYLGMFDSSQQHQQQHQQQQRSVLDLVKREEMFSVEPHGRIGLNLGGRTYFSAEDHSSAAARLGCSGIKRSRMNALGSHAPMCQVQGCSADLSKAKHYHRRHKVCELHSKAPNVIAAGRTQRFCQQCSRFHQLSEFDDTKRSCRKRLADHNRRRRKPQQSGIATTGEPFNKLAEERVSHEGGGEEKSMVLQVERSKNGSPSGDSIIMSSGNRLQVQSSPGYAAMDDNKLSAKTCPAGTSISSGLMSRGAQPMPSSDVQALVLSVVSRTPTPAAGTHNSSRQSPGTQESVYQQYLHGPSLSLSSAAGMSAAPQSQQQQSPSSHHNYMDQVPWLGGSSSNTRSTIVQTRNPLQQAFSPRDQAGSSFLDLVHAGSEQLGRLGLQNTSTATARCMDGAHPMLALIENQAHQQQLTSSVDDIKPHHHLHHHSETLQSSTGVRSSFGSSFYDSSSSIG